MCPSTGTNWTMVWMFNGIAMLLQGINLVVLTVGTFFFMPRYIGTICNWIMGCFCNAAWIALAMSSRGSAAGELCEDNEAPVVYLGEGKWDDSGITYSNDAMYMRFLIWLQCALWALQMFVCWIPCFCTPVLDEEWEREQKDKKAKKEEEEIQLKTQIAVMQSQKQQIAGMQQMQMMNMQSQMMQN